MFVILSGLFLVIWNEILAENIVGIFLVGRREENFHYWKILYIYIRRKM